MLIAKCYLGAGLGFCFLDWDGCYITEFGIKECYSIAKKDKGVKDVYQYIVYSPIKSHTTVPTFVRVDEANTGFGSLYQVPQDAAKAIEQAGSTAQFKGCVWGERLWIDVDSYEAAERTEQRLMEMGLDFVAYDSGGKGAHFGVLRNTEPSHLLPLQDREWVREHFPEADTSIYTHLHMFRLPGTIHEVTGRPKELVREVKGKALVLPKWERKEVSLSSAPSESSQSIFECERVMSNTLWARKSRLPIGERHPTLVRIAYALRDDAGTPANMALWWIQEVNKLSNEPRDQEHLEHIIRSIYG